MRFTTVLFLTGAVAASAQTSDPRAPVEVVVEKDVEYGVASDVSLRLDIYRPKERSQDLMAAVVWIHGGGWRGGDKNNARNARAAAERGFFAVSLNYRLSGVAKFPAAVEDCKCAVRWLRASAEKYGVDPERIGVWGSSAGGHLALMVGLADEKAGLEGKGGYARVSSRVAAVCSWFGPAELEVIGTGGGENAVGLFLGEGAAAEAYAKASPVTHATPDDPPVLLIHGDKDTLVPLSQSERMLKALEAAAVPVELLVVRGAGHGWKGAAISPSTEEILERSLGFFEETLAKKE